MPPQLLFFFPLLTGTCNGYSYYYYYTLYFQTGENPDVKSNNRYVFDVVPGEKFRRKIKYANLSTAVLLELTTVPWFSQTSVDVTADLFVNTN